MSASMNADRRPSTLLPLPAAGPLRGPREQGQLTLDVVANPDLVSTTGARRPQSEYVGRFGSSGEGRPASRGNLSDRGD